MPKAIITYAFLYVATAGVLGLVWMLANLNNIPVATFTRDMAAIAEIHPLTGLLSNIGILMWSWAAAISGFTGLVLFRSTKASTGSFLLSSGCLTLVLLLDDLFMFHEDLAKRYFGFNEKVVYFGYVVITLLYFLFYWRHLFSSQHVTLLIMAFICFGASIGTDVFLEPRLGAWPSYYLVEDGFKFIGIVSWLGYFALTSYSLLQRR
jgi:hypothetical protein